MLLSEIRRLLVIAALPTHRDCRVQIKLQVSRRLDERLELLNVLQLSIAVEQKCRVIRRGFPVFVELFEVLDEVVNALRIKELECVRLARRCS